MTTNPYVPPETDVAASGPARPPAQKSFARRMSFVLAAVGFVGFWGALLALASGDENAQAEIALGLVTLLALVAHLLGMMIMFAAPRGRRMLPALLNAFCFTIIIGVMVLGLTVGKE